jgi:hypothetical protein
LADSGEHRQKSSADGKELELSAFSSEKQGVEEKSYALSGISPNGDALPLSIDPDLQAVVDAWPSLSAAARSRILEVIRQEAQA